MYSLQEIKNKVSKRSFRIEGGKITIISKEEEKEELKILQSEFKDGEININAISNIIYNKQNDSKYVAFLK